ncbi:S8 family serine peptidase [Gottfriedia acidiceleris]|uniref:S8 family serine peptidase n=1 Tax=Gottfriedia acidiceleris TaxID=371036 RepID=UPI00249EAF22|nr:S8 family serine peptidase [Gottfriedia acidiceleris]
MKKQVTTAVLATALVAELIAPTAKNTPVVHASSQSKIDQVLQSLTEEQRKAIQDLSQTSTEGLQLSPETDLTSEKEISVIVEFKNKPAKTASLIEKSNGRELALEDAEKLVEDDHAVFKQDVDRLGIKGKISRSYKQVYNGVAMTLPANEVKSLLKSKAVKNVWENQVVQLDDPTTSEAQGTAETSAYTGSDPQKTMGVDKLQKEGITGKGIKIGVIDSGMDYNHPDLKDAFKGGYDFVDNDNDPMETTYDDWVKSGMPANNGRTYWTDHGTHVSGIIGGRQKNNSVYAMKGVAPDADLYAYRVLGPYGSGTEENIIAGIEQSVKDKMDVINLSLGNSINSPFEPSAVAVSNAVLDGVTAVLAAGNNGSAMYTVGSPAASPLAITVGSTNTEVSLPGFMGTYNSGTKQGTVETHYCTSGFGIESRLLKGQTIEVVDVNSGKESDYDNINVKDKIALISTGDLTITQKVTIAKAKGAKAVLIYDKWGPGYISDTLQELPGFIPTQVITTAQGKAMKELLKTGPVTFTFNEIKEKVTALDDTLSFFSSRGPARSTYDIKPEIVAPGASIMSTVSGHYRTDYPGNYNYAYDKFSGTSMASPQVAGVAALLLQADPKLSPGEIKSTLMNTADAIQTKDSVYEVGAGRVDAYEAVHAVTSFKVPDETLTLFKNEKEKTIKEITGSLSFGTVYASDNDVEESKDIDIQNRSSEEQQYDVKVNYQAFKGSLNAVDNGVVLETAPSVIVKAGGKETLSTKIKIPTTAKNGTYEGYVTFVNKANSEDIYQIPFAIRKVKYGVSSINMTTSLTTIQENGITRAANSIQGSFTLSSHMKTVDLFLKNAVTGEDMGFVGNFDGTWINENQSVTVGFSGSYYPFTNDKENPVSYESKMAEPGSYQLKFVFTDDQGNETTIEKPFIIDNETPTIETEIEPGIVEMDPASTVISVKGKIHDKQIDDLVALGLQAKQGNNILNYRYNNNPFGQQYAVDELGNFNYSTNFSSGQKVLPISLYSTDKAGLPSVQKEFFFVRKGTNYISTVADQKEVKTGDVINFISKANNSTSWKEAKWNYQFNKDYLALESIQVSDELKDKVSLETTETSNGISVTLKALQGSISASEMLPLLNVKAKVKDDKFIDTYVALAVTSPTYTDANGIKTQPAVAHPSVRVWPKYSKLQGDMNGEAIYYRDGYGQLKTTYVNYFAVGATIKVKDQNGNTYEGKVINDAKFIVEGLPTDRKPLTFVFDVPGHFTVQKTFTIGREGAIGELQKLNFKAALAGDVNKDNLIDIDDAVYLKSHWKSSDRKADLNFDGIVDMKDMDFIKKNYLQENPTVKADKTQKQNSHGQTLEEIIGGLN